MKIGELKELIKDVDDEGKVWIHVADMREWVDCTASIDDEGTLILVDAECGDEK